VRNDDGKTERSTRLRQEYHPHLLARCTLARGRESGACARIDGRASLPGSAGPRKSRVARIVSSLQFRSDIRATSDLRADRTSERLPIIVRDRSLIEGIGRVSRPASRRAGDTPVVTMGKKDACFFYDTFVFPRD